MKILPTPIPDLLVIEPDVYVDSRGYFLETYNKHRYQQMGIMADFVQDNLSCSHFGVVRGLHFQKPPFAQAKLVSCTVGKVWDVAVDLRQKSPTFKHWFAVELTEDNHKQFFIPQGFAHGFVAISNTVVFTYKCDNFFHPEAESGISIFDPEINIQWPVNQQVMELSDVDKSRLFLQQIANPF